MSKFCEGDRVRVKTYEEIKNQFKYGETLPSGCCFPPQMQQFCGSERTIVIVGGSQSSEDGVRYSLDGIGAWVFTHEMLDLIYDDISNDADIEFSFEDLMDL